MARFRVITIPSRKAHSEWRPSKEEAIEDAIRLELAQRDDDDPSRVHWDPVTIIECETDEGGLDVIHP